MATDCSPAELADLVRPHLDRCLVGFDVDGVLAPIVEHADDSRLSPGVHESLTALSERTVIAILSGRSLASLERLFAFPAPLHVVGSHGLETRGTAGMELDGAERQRFEQLEFLGTKAVEAAGDGAWLEYKPASVVFHTRAADPPRAAAAVGALDNLATKIEGAQVKHGQHVVELLARSASKGRTLLAVADQLGRSPILFLGDDLTDEDAFRAMTADDVPVRVGPGETAARYRLDGPDAVADFLTLL